MSTKTPIDVVEYAPHILRELKRGVLLSAAADGKRNAMTIGWGTLGIDWSQPVFVCYVRTGRYTHELLERSDSFTVNVPMPTGDAEADRRVRRAIARCGTTSGREVDKASEFGLTFVDGSQVEAPAILEVPLTLECKIIYRRDQDISLLPDDLRASCYPADVPSAATGSNRDPHTAYYGQIVDAYILS